MAPILSWLAPIFRDVQVKPEWGINRIKRRTCTTLGKIGKTFPFSDIKYISIKQCPPSVPVVAI